VEGVIPSEWCAYCCTRHADAADCPGVLEATGSERPGWRVNVETPQGIQAYGALLAPTLLPLDQGLVQLRGTVCWQRTTPHAGRPPGMGIRLEAPPPAYVDYVRALP
jgi:hypothetical protein